MGSIFERFPIINLFIDTNVSCELTMDCEFHPPEALLNHTIH
jgi:hypothetical protein